jgi:hypothetical protein
MKAQLSQYIVRVVEKFQNHKFRSHNVFVYLGSWETYHFYVFVYLEIWECCIIYFLLYPSCTIHSAGDQSGTSVRNKRRLQPGGSQVLQDIDGEAQGDLGNLIDSGIVGLYQYYEGEWLKGGEDIDGEAAGDFSGQSIALSSDGCVVAIGSWKRSSKPTGQTKEDNGERDARVHYEAQPTPHFLS